MEVIDDFRISDELESFILLNCRNWVVKASFLMVIRFGYVAEDER